ncbi:tRNA-modifying protein YgfZ [Buchnera aphidicola (Kurisakia onigurumii)]|uniref:tRNA-modifying protein YgfZ n=1 Tax=Buchnera aphidicola TaxID=9 RepID=UPI0031B725B1
MNFSTFNDLNQSIKNLQNYFLQLTDWVFVYVSGNDAKKYLQTKFTININKFNNNTHTICSHCNSQGKVLSVFYFFVFKSGYGYIQRKSVARQQIQELEKYSIFSDIKIRIKKNYHIIGMSNNKIFNFFKNYFLDVSHKNNSLIKTNFGTILYFFHPYKKFLLIVSNKKLNLLYKKFFLKKILVGNEEWLLSEIKSGFPVIDLENYAKFFPQNINLKKLKALDFYKGCYQGQEIISRLEFRGKNKYSIYILYGNYTDNLVIGENIEKKKKDSWIHCGFILSAVKINSNGIYIQAMLRKTTNKYDILRINNIKNIFFYLKKY